ncbi:putative snur portin-like protein [Tribonema minus]|uniref:Snurportin-1 n=1 Tax=Tribonema minus TaxID=303371 RepID=A0A835ZF81_9STRA|nr:putative snur portin-like protein [Tribonema minus]
MTSVEQPGSSAPRASAKSASLRRGDQQRRRQDYLRKQKEARRQLTNHARNLATTADEPSHGDQHGGKIADENLESMEVANGQQQRKRSREEKLVRRRDYWSRQFACPEWILDVPEDLNGAGSTEGEGWFVMPRPEGKRVMLIAAEGRTIARTMNGAITHSWHSTLWSGGAHSRKGPGCTVLDCVFHELDQTFYVIDMMCWSDYSLYDCTSEFRQYWIRTKLAEAQVCDVSEWNQYRIRPVPCYDCHPQGLAAAYGDPVPYIRDGLLFVCKAGHYSLGTTPLVLLWKDEATTRYDGIHATPDPFTGENSLLYPLATADDPPVVLQHSTEYSAALGHLKEGDLLRFFVSSAELAVESDGSLVPVVQGLVFDKRCSPVRPMADSWSKAVFQSAVRTGRGVISIGDIAAVVAAGGEGMATDGKEG